MFKVMAISHMAVRPDSKQWQLLIWQLGQIQSDGNFLILKGQVQSYDNFSYHIYVIFKTTASSKWWHLGQFNRSLPVIRFVTYNIRVYKHWCHTLLWDSEWLLSTYCMYTVNNRIKSQYKEGMSLNTVYISMDFNQSLTFLSKSHFVTPYKHMDKKNINICWH